ncbi:MAG: SPOR domain-containing protein [Alphaproteobacteria bacterium]|nr:SPOR domain-containing protein [Alphaproteobacteria bacterium]
MVDQERGAYTPPTDSPLAFEARQPVRGARPFPVTLVISVLVLIGLAAAIFVFYRSGLRQGSGAPQDLGQPIAHIRSPASPDAQPQDPAEGLEIYRSESGQAPQLVPTQPQFTPPPEQPQPRPGEGPPVVLAPPTSLPPAAASAAASATSTQMQTASAAPALRPAQNPPPPPAQAATPKPVAVKPAAPKVEKPAAKPKPVAAAPAPSAKAGAAVVQIGAVSSPALADKTWNDAVTVAPGLAAGKGKGVEKVEKDGRTLYRTSVTGFSSRAQAQAFCDKLKAAGKACFVR